MSDRPARAEVGELARTYGRHVYHAAYRVLGDTALAEDVQQDVFVRLLEGGTFDVVSWPGYLATLAVRLAIDRLRRHQRWRRLLPSWLAQPAPVAASTEDATLMIERAQQLRQALSKLKAREAECFALRFVQGLEIAEIATALGITPNLVSVTLHRATGALRSQLADIDTDSKEQQ